MRVMFVRPSTHLGRTGLDLFLMSSRYHVVVHQTESSWIKLVCLPTRAGLCQPKLKFARRLRSYAHRNIADVAIVLPRMA